MKGRTRGGGRPKGRYSKRAMGTPVGLSIQELAIGLKSRNAGLSIDDAKKKAKELIKASDTIKKASGEKSSGLLSYIFGPQFGKRLTALTTSSKKESAAIELLAKHKEEKREADRVPKENYKEILKRLEKIDVKVEKIEAVKTQPPAPVPVKASATAKKMTPRSKEMSDAKSALANMYKGKWTKKGIDESLEGAPEGASIQELINYALRDPSKKIPKEEVPQHIEEMKGSMEPPPAPAEPTPSATATQVEPQTVSSDQYLKTEKSTSKKKRDDFEKEEKESKFRKFITDSLGDLEKKMKKGDWGILDWLITAFAAGGIVGNILYTRVLKPVEDVIQRDIKEPLSKFLNFFGIKNDDQRAGAERDAKLGIAETKDDAIKNHKKSYSPLDADGQGSETKFIHKEDIIEYNKKHPNEQVTPYDSGKKTKKSIVPNKKLAPKVHKTAEKLKKDDRVVDDKQPIQLIYPPAAPTVVSPPSSSGGVVMNLRNGEPSAASYVGSLFEHPVTHPRGEM